MMSDVASSIHLLQQAFASALALQQSGQLLQSEAAYRRILDLDPANIAAHNNLGNVLLALGRASEAEPHYRRALSLMPGLAVGHNHLGKALTALGHPADAEHCHRRACELDPGLAEAHIDLANLLVPAGRIDEAATFYAQAIALKPESAELHNSLGAVLAMRGRHDQALRSFMRARELNPGLAEAHCNLGSAFKIAGRFDEAEESLRQALALNPNMVTAHSNLIFLLDLLERCDAREQQGERARWYQQHAARFSQSIAPHDNTRDPERRLRIGYVSADFREHSAFYAFSPVLFRHNRAAFDVVCYSGVRVEDQLTARMKQSADAWRPTVGMSDEALAEQIRGDGIDILVDLSGHSEDNRLLVFARKPAPIQVTAWGHPTGTGLPTIDYFLADPVLVPAKIRPLLAEKVFDLPCERCYDPPEYLPAVTPPPSLAGHPFTFAHFNRVEKISNTVVRLWSRILAALPGARLFVKDSMLEYPNVQEWLLQKMGAAGIAPERVRLLGKTSHREQLAIYADVDVCLDPFPQGGAISTAEALWMGVPVVSLYGWTIVSRQGAMNLVALEMEDWIAHSEDDYVRIAVAAAGDLPRLSALRQGLRLRIANYPFGDLPRFTRAVERGYRTMWREWCSKRLA